MLESRILKQYEQYINIHLDTNSTHDKIHGTIVSILADTKKTNKIRAKNKPYFIPANPSFESSNTNNSSAINPSFENPDIKQLEIQSIDDLKVMMLNKIETLFETSADMKSEFNSLLMYKLYNVLFLGDVRKL